MTTNVTTNRNNVVLSGVFAFGLIVGWVGGMTYQKQSLENQMAQNLMGQMASMKEKQAEIQSEMKKADESFKEAFDSFGKEPEQSK